MNTIVYSIICLLFFTGCGKYDLNNRIKLANTIASQSNLIKEDIKAKDFTLRVFRRNINTNRPLKIYIEGDGFAWINKNTISPNPTPINPVALKLASLNTSSNIAYIARPCQYISTDNCKKKYWTNKIFSKKIINNINQVITILKNKTKSKKIELIGFSGGAAIAALISSKRDDIIKLTTIAGNLNHKLLYKYHHIKPMTDSLNPLNIASDISYISQVHYVGEFDKVVPLAVIQSFIKASYNYNNIKLIIVKGATHTRGWDKLKGL